MAHPVKVNGKIFAIPGGALFEIMSQFTRQEKIDYKALKIALMEQEIPHAVSESAQNGHMGYLNFDLMEAQESRQPISIGNYDPDKVIIAARLI
ncbi:MAG: hypothetical protein HY513_04180 [Candidatus Aenigmarchaeota archaeon]|nr:hypothetical protein [Candidatus Aenigmarchaeota archaeon]